MKRMLFAPMLLAVCLAGCGGMLETAPATPSAPPGPITAPADIAARITFDEIGVIVGAGLVEATADALTIAVETGIVKGARLDQAQAFSRDMRSALAALDAAYRAVNAADFRIAATKLARAIGELRTISKGVTT